VGQYDQNRSLAKSNRATNGTADYNSNRVRDVEESTSNVMEYPARSIRFGIGCKSLFVSPITNFPGCRRADRAVGAPIEY
jgi:hypothetical protein